MTTFWHDARMLNAAANVLIIAALTAVAACTLTWMVRRPLFELNDIAVAGFDEHKLTRVTANELRRAGLARIDGNFFTVNLAEVRARFEAAPWVRHAEVRRVWPNRLEVSIEEHKPLAHWADGRLVNTFGELFSARLTDAEESAQLLRFGGPEGTQRLVTQRYDELASQLRRVSMRPKEVNLSDRQAWSARLDNGITLLIGRDEGVAIMDRVSRWAAVYPQVQSRINERTEVIDLRYPNGFAVRAPGVLDGDHANDHRTDGRLEPRLSARP